MIEVPATISPLIGIIDSNPQWLRKTERYLGGAEPGYRVVTASDGLAALDLVRDYDPDLLLLADPLPGLGTDSVVSRVREFTSLPIIVLGNSDPYRLANILNAGADNYLVKEEVEDRELPVRIRALLRRASMAVLTKDSAIFTNGELTIDFDQHRVKLHDRDIPLSPTEYELLACLAQDVSQVFSSEDILSRIWGGLDYSDNILRKNINRLRAKLGEDSRNPHLIATRVGVGYLMPNFGHSVETKVSGDNIELLIGPIDREDVVYPYQLPKAKLSEEIVLSNGLRLSISARTRELINAVRFLPEGNAVVGKSLLTALRLPDYYIDNTRIVLKELGSDHTIGNVTAKLLPARYYWEKLQDS